MIRWLKSILGLSWSGCCAPFGRSALLVRSALLGRAMLFGSALLCTSALPAEALAQPTEEQLECMDAYEKTQEARQAGNLLRARVLTQSCIIEACHEVIRDSCRTWQKDLAAEIPSVTIRVVDEAGKPLGGATVVVDGKDILSSAGRTLELDPGTHSVDVSVEGYESNAETFQLASGEKQVPIEISLVAKPTTPPATPVAARAPLPLWPSYALGAVSAAGFASLGIFGSRARSDDRELDSCAPTKTCDQDEVDKIKTQYTLANVGLGVGIAGVVGAVGWTLFALESRSTADAGERNAHSGRSLRVVIALDGVSAQGEF